MTIEMVNLPIFGEGVGVPFPYFGFEKKEGRAAKKLVKSTKAMAREILGKMSNREYLARHAITGTMPWLNRVFEEFRVHHEEHDVPTRVHKSIEDKARKAAAKNVTVVAEARKRKGLLLLLPPSMRPQLPPLMMRRRLPEHWWRL